MSLTVHSQLYKTLDFLHKFFFLSPSCLQETQSLPHSIDSVGFLFINILSILTYDWNPSATFLPSPVTLFIAFLFPSLDHLVARGPIERTGPVGVILDLLIIDVDGAGQHIVAVGLAVAGLAHPPHVVLEDRDNSLGPAEEGRAVQHPAHQLIDVHGPLALAGVSRAR